MSQAEKYDVLVFGSGTGGKLVGWTMAKEGKRTAVVERKMIGGSCPNVACLPSKNIIHTAKVASLLGRHRVLRDAVFAHPTMTEGLKSLFAGVPPLAGADVDKREAVNVHAEGEQGVAGTRVTSATLKETVTPDLSLPYALPISYEMEVSRP